MRPLNEIIIHATATPANWRDGQKTSTKVAEVRRWHVEDRGWSDIGYHYLIDRDGTVALCHARARTSKATTPARSALRCLAGMAALPMACLRTTIPRPKTSHCGS